MIERDIAPPPVTIRRSRFSLRRLTLAALALAALLGGAAFGRNWWTVGRFVETTDDAYVGGDVTPIAPHVAGFVRQILVRDNQFRSDLPGGTVFVRNLTPTPAELVGNQLTGQVEALVGPGTVR